MLIAVLRQGLSRRPPTMSPTEMSGWGVFTIFFLVLLGFIHVTTEGSIKVVWIDRKDLPPLLMNFIYWNGYCGANSSIGRQGCFGDALLIGFDEIRSGRQG